MRHRLSRHRHCAPSAAPRAPRTTERIVFGTQLVPAGTSCYQLVRSWYRASTQLVPAATSWVLAGYQTQRALRFGHHRGHEGDPESSAHPVRAEFSERAMIQTHTTIGKPKLWKLEPKRICERAQGVPHLWVDLERALGRQRIDGTPRARSGTACVDPIPKTRPT